MAEIRSGASWFSLLALAIGIGLIAYLAYSATKKTDSENYNKGATHNETTITVSPTYNANPLSFPPCGRIFTIDEGSLIPKNDAKVKK